MRSFPASTAHLAGPNRDAGKEITCDHLEMIYVRYALVIPGMGMVAVVVLRPVVKRVGAICSFRLVRQA